jgi:ribosome-associated protein YbcJ (S4-like RNA binding protein)
VTGGEAKRLVQSGAVSVNGTVEARRSHKVVPGDSVVVAGTTYLAIWPKDAREGAASR